MKKLVLYPCLLLPALLAGCTTCQVQIWANSDSDDPNIGSPRSPHYVHVGETAQFRVYVQPDLAGYVLMDIGGQMMILPRINPGEYALTKKFDENWRDHACYLTARAYRQNGRPDYLVEGAIVRKLNVDNDPPDQLLGTGTMTVSCYQSKIVIRIKAPATPEPDWSKASLQIFGLNNQIATVPFARPGADGFVALGHDTWGYFNIFYEPNDDQVHRTGKTKALFTYPDPKTNTEQKLEVWFDTP
jgi:hypothetical protein